MNLSGNYIGRTGRFQYTAFAKDVLNALAGESTNAGGMCRLAIEHGATDESDKMVVKLRDALDTCGKTQGFKRHLIKGQKGYFFKAV